MIHCNIFLKWLNFEHCPSQISIYKQKQIFYVENNDGSDLNMLYWLDEHLRWTTLDTALPTPLSYHCSVQINDCEIAIIGGSNARYFCHFKTYLTIFLK